jgi:ATP-binding cassette subfamily B (MDR/TAP) protein 1
LIVQALVSLGLAFYTDWNLTLVVLAALPVLAMGVAMISRPMEHNLSLQAQMMTKAASVASNVFSNIVTVKCLNTQELETSRYTGIVSNGAVYFLKQAFTNALSVGFVRFITTTMFVQGKTDELRCNS